MSKKIRCALLIDDDEPTNFLHRWILENSGMIEHVHVAESGQQALDFLTSPLDHSDGKEKYHCPDLIFLDINMPAMNGWEFLEKYRKLDKKQQGRIVLVMLTTSLFPEDAVKARDIPEVSGFESKPLNAEALMRIIDKYFP